MKKMADDARKDQQDRQPGGKNISPEAPGALEWTCQDPVESLKQLLQYVESEADKAIAWYWQRKKWKARLSRGVQFLAVVLTALAGIVPVASTLLQDVNRTPISPLWSSLLVGVAAALLGVDRAFGYSSGWARYMLAATAIRKNYEEFRMDWIALTAGAACPTPTPEQVAAMVQKAKDFRVGVEAIVLQETRDWVTEFQSNISQLEKEARAQVEQLKAEAAKALDAQRATTQVGSLEVTVVNADRAQGFAFTITVEGADGVVIKDEQVSGSRKWSRANVKPGQYTVRVSATSPATAAAPARGVGDSAVVIVKPGEIGKGSIELPI
jgi:SMODS and SLOG-associating 2TM effector domain 2